MTTTTTKIGTAPAFSTDVTFKPVITAAWTSTNSNFPGTANVPIFVKSATVTLVGQSDAAKAPAKTVSDWLTAQASAISGQSLTTETKVSSWAVVVDVTTNKNTVYNQAVSKSTANPALCEDVTKTGGLNPVPSTAPAAGAAGDTFNIILNTGTTTNKQPLVIRAGAFVKTPVTTSAAQVSENREENWSATVTGITDYKDHAKNTTPSFTWTKAETCDTTKWSTATDCKSLVGHWAWTTATWQTTTTDGSHRFYQWLADNATEKTKILSIEDKEVLNLIIAETYAFVFSSTAGANTNSCANSPAYAGSTKFSVHTATYAKGSGASSTILGASALVAGLLASLF